ncbi:hypothetical protein SAMN05192533_11672 [Mesobacillus persicus]|uniref:Uncharacterized protein n=1 Tax=Mesobacillus persicus TaxID=930146 RepID=A0A1H8I776_9BACI|nr:hypothetical protein [Mesobacillus persicus]SEN63995.1 hypothetical protein SAMN05192533_11672 [Mesobacillus persicus]
MNGKIFTAAIFIIVISWGMNYAYYHSKLLEKPIFLEHFYEAYIQDERQLTFYYLTNKQNAAEVSHVVIDGVEGVNVRNEHVGFWNDSGPRFNQEFRHHYLKSVTLEFRQDSMPLGELDSTFTFETMEVFFQDQSTVIAEIGKVVFYPEDEYQRVFDSRMSSGSNQHRSEEALVANEPLSIDRITIPFADKLAGEVAVKVDLDQERLKEFDALKTGGDFPAWFEETRNNEWEDTPGISIDEGIFPLRLDSNEWLSLNMYFNPERTSFFEFSIQMEGATDKGESFVHRSHIIDAPNLNQQKVDQLVDAKKEGED